MHVFRTLGAAVVCAALATPGALARDQVRMDDPGDGLRAPGFEGGAFRATSISGNNGQPGGFGGTGNSFLTFCLERTERVSMGTTYFTSVSDSTMAHVPDGDTSDPISSVTAALYLEFRNGGNFGGVADGMLDTGDEIRSLQRAIWIAEDEILSTEYNDPLAMALHEWAMNNNNGELNNVRVLRLWTDENMEGSAQDMLTILVPLPPAVWHAGSVLAGVFTVSWLRRRSHHRTCV